MAERIQPGKARAKWGGFPCLWAGMLLFVFGWYGLMPPAGLSAQEGGTAGEEASGESASGEEAGEDLGEAGEAGEAGAEDPLTEREKLLARDLETASYYELVDWARSLGLAESGSAAALQSRIQAHLGVPETPDAGKIEGAQIISIESADQAETFQVEAVKEDIIRLMGGVRLVVREEGSDGPVHILEAEELLFNRSRKRVTARGGVTYSAEGGDEPREYQAETLSFQVDPWQGFFVEGVSDQERTIEGEKLIFHFMGDRIYTAGKDVIILDGGTITSSKTEDPYYRVDARKVWLLGPGEWGISRGTLFIGRIPVFYLPFFYHPGDDMIFNPVIGYRVKDGSYIQTTTYLLGEKEKDDSALSFMKIVSEGGAARKKERVGLFLRKTEEPAEDSSGDSFKILADYYSNLGYFGGISGSWQDVSWADKLDLNWGAARSRNIYQSRNEGLYSPYEPGSGDASVWHNTPLPWGGKTSLRYGFDLTYQFKKVDVDLEYYSEPYFAKDFYDRAETFNWIDYLYRDEPEMTSTESEKNYLNWSVQSRWSLPVSPALRPLIQRVSVNQLSSSLSWQTKEDLSYGEEDPRRRFYYPEELSLPQFKLTVSGSFLNLSWPGRKEEDEGGENGGGEDVLPPWEGPAGESEGEDQEREESREEGQAEEELKLPKPLSPDRSSPASGIIDLDWSYQLFTDQSWKGLYSSDDWNALAEVDYEPRQGLYTTQNRGSSRLNLDLGGGLLRLDDTISGRGQYREHQRLSTWQDPEWDSKREADYRYNSAQVDNESSLRLYPLMALEPYEKSYLGYQWNINVWSRELEEMVEQRPRYKDQWYDARKETTESREVQAALISDWLGGSQEFSYTADLPPLEEASIYAYDVGFQYGMASARAYSDFSYREKEWEYKPLYLKGALEPLEWAALEAKASYEIEHQRIREIRNVIPRLTLGPFYTELTYERGNDYHWAGTSWAVKREDVFQLQQIRSGLNWQKEEPFRLWYRRVTVKPSLDSSWYMDIDRINENALEAQGSLTLGIAEFMYLDVSFMSENSSTFRYIPGLSEDVFGVKSLSLPQDLLRSVDFFNWTGPEARERSHFNLKKIDVSLVHHMADWDLELSYSAYPEVRTREDDTKFYKWIPEISILLQWNPIPEIMTHIEDKEEGFTVETRETSG